MVLKNIERPLIETVLGKAEGNQSAAAAMLGIDRNTLRKKIQQLRIKAWRSGRHERQAGADQRLRQDRRRRIRARAAALGVQILSTGGTAKLLEKEGVRVTEVSAHTGFPEMLDGRVKTLHPQIHGGILARRDLPRAHGGARQGTASRPSTWWWSTCTRSRRRWPTRTARWTNAIENIDIGGPAMLRAAAKNYARRRGGDRPGRLRAACWRRSARGGGVADATRFALAKKVFAHTAGYDGAIANYLTSLRRAATSAGPTPSVLSLQFRKLQDMRYGENPHQSAAFYRDMRPIPGGLAALSRSCRARSFPTTTSPMPTPPGNA